MQGGGGQSQSRYLRELTSEGNLKDPVNASVGARWLAKHLVSIEKLTNTADSWTIEDAGPWRTTAGVLSTGERPTAEQHAACMERKGKAKGGKESQKGGKESDEREGRQAEGGKGSAAGSRKAKGKK